MSTNTDADVNITLSATDNASTTVSSATKQINSEFRAMRQTQDAVGRSYLVNNQSLYAYGRAAQAVGRITDKAISLFNSYNLMQIRIAQATQTNTDAQETLAETIAQYGQNSPQAQKASEQAIKAQDALKKATEDAQKQFALMIASMVAQSGTMITTVIPRLQSLISVLRGVQTAEAGAAIVGAASPVAGITGAAATGGVASALTKIAPRVASIASKAAGPAALGVSLLSMMGEQQAGETSIPTGIGALQQIGGDMSKTITNTYNIIVQDAGAAAKTVQNELSKVLTFGGQPAS